MNTLRRDTNGLLEANSERARAFVQPAYADPERKAKDAGVRRAKQEVPSDKDSDGDDQLLAYREGCDTDSEEFLSTIPFFSRVKGP